MTRYDYRLVDVFTEKAFGGNPLAVFREPGGLDAKTMQAVAKERREAAHKTSTFRWLRFGFARVTAGLAVVLVIGLGLHNRYEKSQRTELAAGPASFARGKLVFENQCAKCHKFDGRGHEVGPALDGAARDLEYLLVNVLDPNRVVGQPYYLRTVERKDGRLESGLLHAEDEQAVTLKAENDQLKVSWRPSVPIVGNRVERFSRSERLNSTRW